MCTMNTSYWGKVVNGQVRRGGRSLRDGPVRLPPRHARPAGHSPRLGANFDERARRHELLGLRIRRRNTVDQHRAPRAGAAAEIRRRTAPCDRRGSRSGTARACGRESRWSGRGRGTRFDDWRREVFDDLDGRAQHARRECGRREPILRGARARSARRENDIAEWLAGEVLTPHLNAQMFAEPSAMTRSGIACVVATFVTDLEGVAKALGGGQERPTS